MTTSCPDPDTLPSQLKHLVADLFRPDVLDPDLIADHECLLGGSMGLDQFDRTELAMSLEETFGIAICEGSEAQTAFASIASLTRFIRDHGTTTAPAVVQLFPIRNSRDDELAALALAPA